MPLQPRIYFSLSSFRHLTMLTSHPLFLLLQVPPLFLTHPTQSPLSSITSFPAAFLLHYRYIFFLIFTVLLKPSLLLLFLPPCSSFLSFRLHLSTLTHSLYHPSPTFTLAHDYCNYPPPSLSHLSSTAPPLLPSFLLLLHQHRYRVVPACSAAAELPLFWAARVFVPRGRLVVCRRNSQSWIL